MTGKIKIAITSLLIVGTTTVNWGQTFLWPGDVSNNGIVNTVDVLYWTLIAEANQISGPRRSDNQTSFVQTTLQENELWATSFPDGVNHAYADCNGDGKVDDKDLDVIIANFNKSRVDVERDTFFTGIQNIDPNLVMEAEVEEVRKGQEAKAKFFLGSPDIPVDSFFAIAITLPYTQVVTKEEVKKAKFVLTDSWMGKANADLRVTQINDTLKNESHFIISRKYQKGIVVRQASYEAIGDFSIVMEDIVLDRTILLNPTNTKMISSTYTETKVYTQGTTFLFKGDETTSTRDPWRAEQKVLIFPNPVTAGASVTLSAEGPDNRIQAFELYNLLGRLAHQRVLDSPASQLRLDLGHLPTGLYLVRVKTDSGFYTGKLKIENF